MFSLKMKDTTPSEQFQIPIRTS